MGSHTTAVYLLAAMSTSSTAPTVEKGERRRLVKPRPAGMRPVKHKNQLPVHHLIHVPKRIFVPPKPDGGVGSVRSFSSTPLRDIKLNDVLAGKYLAPLTMRDFEGYLVYRECSAENLYFILWLREYEKQYKRGRSSDEKPGQPLDHVNALLDRGVSAFFKPDAPLELNLRQDQRDRVLAAVDNSSDPAVFDEAKAVIMDSLAHSLSTYTKSVTANAGPRRLVFCFCLGLSIFLLGLIPPFVGIFGDYARGYRVIGLPFICFGAAVMAMAVQRICGVIWLLGEDRQMLPWELRPVSVLSSSIVPLNSSSASLNSWDGEANPYPWEEYDVKDDDASPPATPAATSTLPGSPRPESYTSRGRTSIISSIPSSAPVFGAVTGVASPEVARAQWSIAVLSLLIGTLVMCIVGAVLLGVPNA